MTHQLQKYFPRRGSSTLSESSNERQKRFNRPLVRMKHSKVKAASAGATNLLLEYCSNSSVHGVRYFGGPERSRCEKFWWLVVFVLSVGSCSLLIHKTYQKWEETPVIVSFAERLTPVWQIPFPAVTICPQTKTKVHTLNFTRDFKDFLKMSPTERSEHNKHDYVLAMTQLCDRNFYNMFRLVLGSLPNKTGNASYSSIVKKLSVDISDITWACTFQSEQFFCDELFSMTLTEEGICASFNILKADELLRLEHIQSEDEYISNETRPSQWSLEHGYSPDASLRPYPDRALGQGFSAGLTLCLVSYDVHLDYLCGGAIQGFKVHLHSSVDYPQVSKKFTYIPMEQDVHIAVKPQMVTTTSGLRAYSPERRLCYFNNERYLKFFKVYTQDNCELECLTNYTQHICGCVRFSMLRANDTSICETNQLSCMLQAETKLLEMDSVRHPNVTDNFRAKCSCLPACTSFQYDAEITQTNLDVEKWAQALNTPKKIFDRKRMARLTIYFKDAQFMSSKRSELYGLTDFLANCGGLLGLCMGVSLLSLVELLYFCSVRPFSLWRRQQVATRDVEKLAGNEETPGITLFAVSVQQEQNQF